MQPYLQFPRVPEQEIENRISKLQKQMATKQLKAVFLTCKEDIYYFCGTCQDAYFYLPAEGEGVLFVKRYFPRAKAETRIREVILIKSVREIPDRIIDIYSRMPETCGLAFDVIPVRDFYFFQKLFHATRFSDAAPLIFHCRQIKSEWEIECISRCAELSSKTFEYIRQTIQPGYSEIEFCGMLETFARKHGHAGHPKTRHYRAIGYSYHLLSGSSGGLTGGLDSPVCGTGTSIAFPYGSGPKIIAENEPILIDFCLLVHGYHADESRMFAIGMMNDTARGASLAAIDILYNLVDYMKPGQTMGEAFDFSCKQAKKLGYEKEYLGLPELKSVFVAHSIGIELVEPPFIAKGRSDILQPGMVFAIEPKLIFKEQFCAGIESLVMITATGAKLLSITPHEIFIC